MGLSRWVLGAGAREVGRVAGSKAEMSWKDLKIPVGTSCLSDGEH